MKIKFLHLFSFWEILPAPPFEIEIQLLLFWQDAEWFHTATSGLFCYPGAPFVILGYVVLADWDQRRAAVVRVNFTVFCGRFLFWVSIRMTFDDRCYSSVFAF